MQQKKNPEVNRKKIGRFILLFIIAAMLFSNKSITEKLFMFFDSQAKTLEIYYENEFQWNENYKAKIYNEGIAVNEKNRVAFYNFEGDELWNKVISYKEAAVYFGQSRIYIGDIISGEVITFDLEGNELWKYNTKQPIKFIAERNNFVLIFMELGDKLQQLNVLDGKGELISNVVIENGKMINGSISKDKEYIVISLLDVSNNTLESKLELYSINGKLIWERNYKEQILTHVDFFDNGNILALSNKKINMLNKKNDLLWSKDIEGQITDTYINKDKNQICLLSNNGRLVETLSDKGRTINKIELQQEYKGLYLNNKDIYLIGNRNISLYRNDRNIFTYESKEDILMFSLSDDTHIIITPNRIKKLK